MIVSRVDALRQNQNTASNAYRPDIDGLRAFAVLLVVAYHAFPEALRGGFVGVDVFFVISGFLIGGIILRDLANGKFSLSHFYARRILRIFPALLLVLAATLIAGYFLLFDDEYEMLGKHAFGGAAFISNLVYYSEAGYWDINAKLKPLLHLWSLGVEEQFYIIIPVALAAAWKRKYGVAALIAILPLASFVCNIHYYKRNPTLDFYMPFTRFWEIFIGVALAALTERGSPARKFLSQSGNSRVKALRAAVACIRDDWRYERFILSFAGVACLIVGVLASRANSFPGHRALWPTFGTAFIIAAGPRTWLNSALFSNKLAVGIGLISYPLYLWHWPLLSFATVLNGEWAGSPQWRDIRIFCVLLSIVLAFLTYVLVEHPVRFGKTGREFKTGISSIVMVCIGASGLYISQAGAPNRSFMKDWREKMNSCSIPALKDGSIVDFAPEAENLRYARYHDAGARRTVAIIGDSHSRPIFPVVAERGAVHGFNTVLLACRLFDRAWQKNAEATLSIIKRKNEVSDVFVFLRGVLHVSGKDLDQAGRIRFGADTYKLRLQGLVDELRDAGKRVYIVSENPVYPYRPRVKFGRPFWNLGSNLPVITREDVYSHSKEYLDALSGIRGAEIINGLDVFIRNNECSMLSEDGLSFYYDDDHLSALGGRHLVENVLEPYLAGIGDGGDGE